MNHLHSRTRTGACLASCLTLLLGASSCTDDIGITDSDTDIDPSNGDGDGDGDGDPSGDGDGDGPPCGGDILGCDDTPTPFEPDPNCALEGELELMLGNGELVFEALSPNTLPDTHLGLQGGQHMWVGLQVRNPALDFPQLEITLELSACRYADVSCTNIGDWFEYSSRVLVVDEDTLTETEEGYFELTNIIYIIEGWNWTIPERWRFRVSVEDPCGRTGQLSVNAIPTG